MSYTAAESVANPADQTFDISNTGGGTLSWSITDDADWLSLSPESGTDAATVTVSVNITSLTAGSYSGTITVAATGASNTPQTVSVDLTVEEPPPAIGLSTTSLSYTAVEGGDNPANQTFDISNTGGGTLSWSITDDAD